MYAIPGASEFGETVYGVRSDNSSESLSHENLFTKDEVLFKAKPFEVIEVNIKYSIKETGITYSQD